MLLLVVVNTPPGQQALAWLTPRVTGDTVRLAGIAGRFPDALRVAQVELRDPQGAYATVEDLALDWSPLQLLHRRIVIDRLEAARIEAMRMPTGSSSGSAGLPMPVILRELRVARLDVGPALAGAAAAVALDGSGELASPTDFSGSLNVRQLDGAGSYAVTAHCRRHTAAGHAARERAGPWPARQPGRAARPGRGGDRCEPRRTT